MYHNDNRRQAMKRITNQRGSVLVMVIGLLTLIAMLGSMFLLVSRLQRRTADALDAAAPDSLIEGIVDQVKAQMLADLHIDVYDDKGDTNPANDEYLPYSAATATAPEDYADFPGESNDAWLATSFSNTLLQVDPPVWPHITNISSETADITDVPFNNARLRDTDSDGINDSIHYRMEVFNANGDEYCAAVRVIDLGGLLCVNTAGQIADATNPPDFTTPVSVDLRGFLGDAVYNALNGDRCDPDGTPSDMGALWTNLASRVPSTTSDYTAFGVGDEMYLRWLTSTQNSSVFTGPLFEATKTGQATPLAPYLRRFLTTRSCSRNLLRRPRAYFDVRIPLRDNDDYFDDTTVPSGETLTRGELHRNALYATLADALGNSDAAKITAAHFVANLWAYMDGQRDSKAYDVEVTGHSSGTNPIVYGVVPQPFVTEIFAYNLQDSGGSDIANANGDDGHASAIELYNPSTNAIALDKYQITKDGGTAEPFPGGASIPANGRFVIYHIEGDFDHDNNPSTARISGTAAMYGIPTANAWDWDDLDFRDGTEFIISRIPETGKEIQVDSVTKGSGGDIDFTATDGLSGTELKDVCRDDSDNDRYAIRESVVDHSGSIPCASVPSNHTLGAYNNLTDPQKATLTSNSGFSILESRPNGATSTTPMSSVSDLMNLFLVGPIDQDSLVTQLTTRASDTSRGYANELVSFATLSNTSYPSVPFGCALAEFFAVIPGYNPADADPVDSRVYGRLNINTATRETLLQLPWPDQVNTKTLEDDDRDAIVQAILDWRDTNGAFTTPGQLAVVLGDLFNTMTTGTTPAWGAIDTSSNNYLEERQKLYNAVADLVAVNSDVYAVTIRVTLEDAAGNVKYGWNYISVVDRSNCFEDGVEPDPLLMPDKVK